MFRDHGLFLMNNYKHTSNGFELVEGVVDWKEILQSDPPDRYYVARDKDLS